MKIVDRDQISSREGGLCLLLHPDRGLTVLDLPYIPTNPKSIEGSIRCLSPDVYVVPRGEVEK